MFKSTKHLVIRHFDHRATSAGYYAVIFLCAKNIQKLNPKQEKTRVQMHIKLDPSTQKQTSNLDHPDRAETSLKLDPTSQEAPEDLTIQ